MPQFDFFTVFIQVFWLMNAAWVFYLINLRMTIGLLSKALKMRKKLNTLLKIRSHATKSRPTYDKCVSAWFKKK